MFNRKSVRVITAPATLAVTLQSVKDVLKIDGSADDNMLTLYIEAATDAAQRYLRSSLINRTIEMVMDGFNEGGDEKMLALGAGVHDYPKSHFFGGSSGEFDLPYAPVSSVTSIKTYDVSNTESTFSSSNYRLDTASGRVYLNQGVVWPSSLRDREAVIVRYVAGYGTASTDIPSAIQAAIRGHVQQMYECSGSCDMNAACMALLDGYRRFDEMGFL